MKKVFLSALIMLSLVTSTFAIGNRIVEIKSDTKTEISNNAFGIAEFLVPEVVLDMSDLSKRIPRSGFNTSASFGEDLSFSVTIPRGPQISFNTGVEMVGSLTASKSLFELIYAGHDFTEEETLTCSVDDTYADVFAYVNATYGMTILDKIRLTVTPTLFSTVSHIGLEDTEITVTNTNEGKFGVGVKGKLAIYSGEETSSITDYNSMLVNLDKNFGFDLAASGSYELFDFLTVGGNFRIPVVPSRPKIQTTQEIDYSILTDLQELMNGTFTPSEFTVGEPQYCEGRYVVNRPMKFAATAVYQPVVGIMPWADIITCYGSLGIGVKHSFTSDAKVYLDYMFATRLSLWNLLNFTVSTEHTDEIFKNKFVLGFNTRLLEIDTGISVASKSFARSFSGGGFGAYFTVCMGF